jgi:hypothetical protein
MTEHNPEKRGRGRPKKPKADPVPPKPRGRPKGALGVLAQARQETVKSVATSYAQEMIHVLARIAMSDDQPAAARTSAAEKVLDRAIGRSVQAIEHSGPDGRPIETRDMSNAPSEVLEWLAGQDTEERTVQ